LEERVTLKDEAGEMLDSVRLLSIANQKLYPVQETNLQLIPLVIFGEKLKNVVNLDFDSKKVTFTLTGKADYPKNQEQIRKDYLTQCTHRILGSDFNVTVKLNNKSNYQEKTKTKKKNKR
jgi:hypothetical protein